MANPMPNESISRIEAMINLPKEEMTAKLQVEPLSFFKDLKELSDEYAIVVYEAFSMHWDRIDKKIHHAQSVMDSLTPRCKDREAYDHIEPIVDLVNKTTGRKILYGHRLVIEATLIAAIDHVLDIAMKAVENLDPNNVNEDDEDSKNANFRADSLHLSNVFFDVSDKYLKSYLDLPW